MIEQQNKGLKDKIIISPPSQSCSALGAILRSTPMRLEQRIVTKIPLEELWTDFAILSYQRQEYLTEGQVLKLLLDRNIEIAEAGCGLKLSWISPNNALDFFKKQIKGHIANDPDRIILEEYEDEWCYLASQWSDDRGKKVILLETYH